MEGTFFRGLTSLLLGSLSNTSFICTLLSPVFFFSFKLLAEFIQMKTSTLLTYVSLLTAFFTLAMPGVNLPEVKLYYETQERENGIAVKNKTITIPKTIESYPAGKIYVTYQKIVKIRKLYHARVENAQELVEAGIDAADFQCKLYEFRGGFNFDELHTFLLAQTFFGSLQNVTYISCSGRHIP